MAEVSHSDPENEESNETGLLRIPACDNCRNRKIRCDRKTPCSSCKSSRIPCKTSQRKPEKKQRILVSSRYQREIEDVGGRLAKLESLLQTLINGHKQAGPSASPASGSEVISTPRDNQQVDDEVGFEGDSSFHAHSKHITQAFENSLSNSPFSSSVRDVSAAIATLRSFLNENEGANKELATPPKSLQEAVHYPELAQLPLPSMDNVLKLLRYCRNRPHRLFYDIPSLDLQEITELCQQIYFPTEEYTISTYITVHVALFYLFRDADATMIKDLRFSASTVEQILRSCETNALTGVRNLRLQMETNYSNIRALLLASMIAMEISRPSQAWTLIAAASLMSQDAGFHRLASYDTDPSRLNSKKRITFWLIYAMERGMSLNFGRTPTIQDWDISVDRPRTPEEIDTLWGVTMAGWLDFAELQGQVYEGLYCYRAQQQPPEVKSAIARDLASRILREREKFGQMHFFRTNNMPNTDHNSGETSNGGYDNLSMLPFTETLQETYLSIEIVLLSTLTLVYRMIPPPQPSHSLKFCDEAIQASRESLTKHNLAWNHLRHKSREEWKLFVHWTLVFCPFVPYIVIFGNVIAERSEEDLKLLGAVVETLQAVDSISSSVGKLKKACTIFYQIALMYLHGNPPTADQRQNTNMPTAAPHSTTASESAPTSTTTSVNVPATNKLTADNLGQLPGQLPLPALQDTLLPDLPLSQQDWDGMLHEWDLGLGAENAREMSMFFGNYLAGIGPQGPFA